MRSSDDHGNIYIMFYFVQISDKKTMIINICLERICLYSCAAYTDMEMSRHLSNHAEFVPSLFSSVASRSRSICQHALKAALHIVNVDFELN